MEGKNHWAGKARLHKILLESGWNVVYQDGEISFELKTPVGDRQYWPDICAQHDEQGWVAFEVDGKKGHSTKRDFIKMRLRDNSLGELDIRTVRIKTVDLVGKKRQEDGLIREEIAYQLSK